MSAINIFVHADRVDILSDGASYAADGTLLAVAPKVWTMPALPAALAVRGPAFVLPFLVVRLTDTVASFDDLVMTIVDRARESVALDAALFHAQPAGDRFELFLAGWSAERKRCEAYTFASFEQSGRAAWTLHDIGPGIVSPIDGAFVERIAELELNLLSSDFHPVADGLSLLEEQRARSWSITGTARAAHIVGGFAMLTTVDQHGTVERVVRRWPDVIGEKISPDQALIAA